MDAVDLARRFALGGAARVSNGPLARGKQGVVWRLETADGSWAVKAPFHQSGEDEVGLATAFQEAAYTAGVPTPQVRRTTEGCVFATVEGGQVRVYEWVDLQAPDACLDPALVGAVVAAIHRVSVLDLGPLDQWYHEPVGARRWDQLVEQLLEAGAPFAGRLAGLRDELVALESWIDLVGRSGVPSVPGRQTGYLLGERLLGAAGLIADEPANRQHEQDFPATDAGVGQPTQVAAVHPPRPCPASGTRGMRAGRRRFDADAGAFEEHPIHAQTRQVRQPRRRTLHFGHRTWSADVDRPLCMKRRADLAESRSPFDAHDFGSGPDHGTCARA